VFKGPRGPAGVSPTYTGYWVDTSDEVDTLLKTIFKAERDRIEETIDYDLLAQNNEASALLLTKTETHAGILVAAVSAEVEAKRAHDLKRIQNATFYLIKLVHANDVIYAVRRTTAGWTTKRALSARSIIFAENRLDLDPYPRFDLEKTLDFFIVGEELLILHKGRFESTLRYKAAQAEDFLALQAEAGFLDLFVDLTPLVEYVGVNKIRLRRICAVRQKAHYLDADFMARVRQRSAEYGFALQFDNFGKIIVTPETGEEVITALLDHRLASGFSNRIYDVPSATQVTV
jgi:hypothetical protein